MNTLKPVDIAREADIEYSPRIGSEAGQSELAWAFPPSGDGGLLAGFASWHEGISPLKILDYHEVIMVLEGCFGIEKTDGTRIEAGKGDVIRIEKGTPLKYFGQRAKLFFTITVPDSMRGTGQGR